MKQNKEILLSAKDMLNLLSVRIFGTTGSLIGSSVSNDGDIKVVNYKMQSSAQLTKSSKRDVGTAMQLSYHAIQQHLWNDVHGCMKSIISTKSL